MPDLSYAAYLRAKAAKAAEVSDAAKGGIAGPVTPRSDNPIFSGPEPDQIPLEDSLPPVEIRATTGIRRKLDDLGKGTGRLDPRRALSPIYQGARAAVNFGNELAGKPLVKAVSPLIGTQDLRGLPEGVANFGDPQAPDVDVTAATGGVTPREKAEGVLQTAANAAFGPATELAGGFAASELGAGATARIAGSAIGAGGVMGAQGAIEGGMAPASGILERTQNVVRGAIGGAESGVITGAVLHSALAEAAPWVGRGMVETAKLAAITAKEVAEDASINPRTFAENRDIRKIFGGLDKDLELGIQAPKVAPPELEPRRIDSAQDIRNTDLDRFPLSPGERARVIRLAAAAKSAAPKAEAPAAEAPPAEPLEDQRRSAPATPKFDFVTSQKVYSPGNMARFARVGHVPGTPLLEGDPELRARIQAGEDLTDAEVHRAEPNNLTPFDIARVEHPLKPGTTIGADLKRDRIRGRVDVGRIRAPDEPLDRTDTVNQLRRMQGSLGGNEFGDLEGLIQRIKNDDQPLTAGRLRLHQIEDVTEHFKNLARGEGVDLQQGRKATILIGPPGSGKSAASTALGKATGAYQIDADAFKTRDPRYSEIGASGTHPESDLLANRARLLAQKRGDSIILPMIGKNTGKIRDLVRELTAQGYEVSLGLTDLSPQESAVRAYNRGLEQNRIVHPDYVIHGVGTTPQQTFDKLKGMEEIGGRYVKVNSDTPRGVPLHAKISELGSGLDRSIFGGPERSAGSDGAGRPGGKGVPAEEGRALPGIPGADRSGNGAPAAPVAAEGSADHASGIPEKRDSAPSGQPGAVEPGRVTTDPYKVATADLRVDPDRFQFKQDVDKATGAGTGLHGAKRFNPDYAGIIDVWKDPENGQTYVVNGHHRFNLAVRDGVKTLQVRNIIANNAVEARVFGALTNIAEGKGTALDVAKFLKDSGLGIDGLIERDVNVKKGLARDGSALAKLSDDLIAKVTQDPDLTRKAVIVGENLDNPEQQRAAFTAMGKLTERQTDELTRVIRAAGSESVDQENLFGTESVAKSLFVEKAKVASAIRDRLSKDKRLFGYVANEGRAAELERGGNKISVAKSREIATKSAQLEELFDRLYSRGGPLGALMDTAAKRVAQGEKPAAVASEIYKEVQAAVQKEIPSARAGRVSKTNEAGGAMLGGLGGAPIGSAAGGALGSQIGSTDEERRRNAERGAALGFAAGAGAGALAGKAAFGNVEPALEGVAKAASRAGELVKRGEGLPDKAAIFDVRPVDGKLMVKIKGPPSIDQINELLTRVRENPGAPVKYSVRDARGRAVGVGSSITDLFSDLTFSHSNTPATGRTGGGFGAIGDQPTLFEGGGSRAGETDLFGMAAGPDQGDLLGEDVGRSAGAKSSGSFTAKQAEARANADFLRKQLARMPEGKARARVAATVAELDRIANFDKKITAIEMQTRAAIEAGGEKSVPFNDHDRRYLQHRDDAMEGWKGRRLMNGDKVQDIHGQVWDVEEMPGDRVRLTRKNEMGGISGINFGKGFDFANFKPVGPRLGESVGQPLEEISAPPSQRQLRAGAVGDQPAAVPSLEDRTVDQHAKELARTGQLRESRNLLNFMRGSKVRQVLFHGTEIPKEEFHAPLSHDLGIHLGTAEVATERLYGRGSLHPEGDPGAQVIPVFAKIRNPLRVKDQGSWYAEDMMGALEGTGKFSDSELHRLKTKIMNGPVNVDRNEPVREFLRSKGYDAVVYRNTGEIPGQWAESDHYIADPARPEKLGPAGSPRHDLTVTDSYVVFDPKQLKSATGNSGEFNPATRRLSGAIGDQPELSPYRDPAERGAYAGESDLVNVQKIVEGSSAQERIADQVEKYRALRDENRTTWEEADKQKSKVVQELLAGDRKAARPHIARKLTGVQLLARRDVVRQNDAMIEDLSKQLASGKLTLEEHNTATELLSKTIQHNDALLSDLVIGSSQKGRDLNLLKRMSTKTLDHDVWQIQAKRMLGDRPLDDATAAQLRRFVNEAKEACGG